MRAQHLLAIASTCAALLGAAPARANGRFPASGQIVVDRSDPSHLVLRATFGILRSRDQGKSWGWICEGAVGYGGVEDPMMGITADGSLLAAVFEGLAASRDDGCGWAFAGGLLAGQTPVDLSVRPTDPREVIVLSADFAGGKPYSARVLRSSDDGRTFAALGGALPPGFVGLTLDAAPSAPSTIYVSGHFGAPDYPGSLLRSTDDGETWARFDIPGAGDRLPYIAAIAPGDPATVYARIDDAPGDALYVTHDGGATWAPIFQAKGDLLAFALSPDGAEIVAGGDTDGLYHAGASALDFAPVAKITARCAAWAASGLYVCADEIADGYSLGRSTDGGKTIAPVMHLHGTCGPLDCPASTGVGQTCADAWTTVAPKLGNPSCGLADAGTTTGGSVAAGPSESGCGCHAGAAPEAVGQGALSAAAALWLARRRRRRRGSA
jgi:MYXO-CTERM domain-containing protein